MSLPNQQVEWETLSSLASDIRQQHMKDWFASDPERSDRYQLKAGKLWADYSKNRITDDVMSALFDLARKQGVEEHRKAMFNGQLINNTEQRAVLHTALRNFSGDPVYVNGQDVMPQVLSTLEKIRAFTESVHSGARKGYTDKVFKHIVSIGIGGSFLGPKIMTEALKPHTVDAVKVHFVANVDGCHIHDVLSSIDFENFQNLEITNFPIPSLSVFMFLIIFSTWFTV